MLNYYTMNMGGADAPHQGGRFGVIRNLAGGVLSVDRYWYWKNNAEICLARGRFRSGRRWEDF